MAMSNKPGPRSIEERIEAIDPQRAPIADVKKAEKYLVGLLSAAGARGDTDEQYALLQELLHRYCMYSMKRKALATSRRILELGPRLGVYAYYNAKAMYGIFGASRHAMAHIKQGRELIQRDECWTIKLETELRLYSLELKILLDTQPKSRRTQKAFIRVLEGAAAFGVLYREVPSVAKQLMDAEMLKTEDEYLMLEGILETAWTELTRQARFEGKDHSAELAELERLIDRSSVEHSG
jgi:hypothetical protein